MEEGKDQELLQSSTTPEPGHCMGKWPEHKKASQQSQEVRAFPAGDRKTHLPG